MKPLLHLSVAAILVASVPALVVSQTRADFSGRWKVSQAKSSRGAIGNQATVTFPSEMVIKQQGAELHIEIHHPRVKPVTVVYKLDGGETTVPAPAGVTEKAKATWDGETLVITARRVVSTPVGDFATDTKEIWSRNGNVVTVRKTSTAEGLSDNETAVYERDDS
jgi:hypothetical protein